jgi:hypothetical protein
MSAKVRYETAPILSLQYPVCDSCSLDVESSGDGWECPQCGTSWDYGDGDGDKGILYAEWSGESVDDLPLLDHLTGWQWRDPNPKGAAS